MRAATDARGDASWSEPVHARGTHGARAVHGEARRCRRAHARPDDAHGDITDSGDGRTEETLHVHGEGEERGDGRLTAGVLGEDETAGDEEADGDHWRRTEAKEKSSPASSRS